MTGEGRAEVLFAGRDVEVGLTDLSGGPLVVTFSPMNAPRPFAEGALLAERATVASVVARWPHWWQTAEMTDALAAIRSTPAFRRAERVFLLGSSMGGTGTLLHSRALGATDVLALCPQVSVDPRIVPFEARWTAERERIAFSNDDMASGLSPTARVTVLFDPGERADREHVSRLRAFRDFDEAAALFCGHFLPRYLQDTGTLRPVLRRFISGTLTGPRLRGAVREGRRGSIEYLCNLAAANADRRRGLALRLLSRARALVAAGTPPIGGRRGPDAEAKVEAVAARLG